MTTPHGRVHLSQIIVAIIVDHGNRDVGGTWRLGPIIWSYLGPNDNYKPTCATLIACNRELIEILGAETDFVSSFKKNCLLKEVSSFLKILWVLKRNHHRVHRFSWEQLNIPGFGWESWNFWYVDSNNNLMAIDTFAIIKIPYKYNTNTIQIHCQ